MGNETLLKLANDVSWYAATAGYGPDGKTPTMTVVFGILELPDSTFTICDKDEWAVTEERFKTPEETYDWQSGQLDHLGNVSITRIL